MQNATFFRTHTCNELRSTDIGKTVTLAGFVMKIRDHGGLLFVDLRDHYGITQCVLEETSGDLFNTVSALKDESVVSITGDVVARPASTENKNMATGEIEVLIKKVDLLSDVLDGVLPVQINVDNEFPEETRLRYRYLDLRRKCMHDNIVLRSNVVSFLRQQMNDLGFLEIQTPILTSSSPEGARDYLVPSRVHPGRFYALPQAPQQFKQLLMVAGFDRYFQIAPCFRDEDSRADRSPGEFYQFDIEMSFVAQEDVFSVVEPVLYNTFVKFAKQGFSVSSLPFQRITYEDAILHYGSDKPDLRNPLVIEDVSDIFARSTFAAFAGKTVRSINVAGAASNSRSFFDKSNDWAKDMGMPGLGYITKNDSGFKGPIAKFLDEALLNELVVVNKMHEGDALFFVCADSVSETSRIAGVVRQKLGEETGIIEKNTYKFCWITDFPMYELGDDGKSIVFSHNPFSMPQGGLDALQNKDPLEIKAYQYDIVCNGVELSSGAIRNHVPAIMYKAFEIAGYTSDFVDCHFGAMINAFKYGAPPHGGCAPGIDRMIMLLADVENIREVAAFPLNQRAEDLLMGAPSVVSDEQLKELHLKVCKYKE